MSDAPEVNSEQTLENEPGGFGGRCDRADSGLTQKADERLTLRAAAWQKGRWDTSATREEIEERIAARGGKPTLKEKIALAAFDALDSKDMRVQGRVMRAGIQMERQVQVDELAALNAGSDPMMQGMPPVAPDQIASAMDASVPDVAAG